MIRAPAAKAGARGSISISLGFFLPAMLMGRRICGALVYSSADIYTDINGGRIYGLVL